MLHFEQSLNSLTRPDSRLSEPTGPRGVTLLDVCGPQSPFLPRVLELFWTLFPKYRRYMEYIRACSLRHTPEHPNAVGHVWAVYDPALAHGNPDPSSDRTSSHGSTPSAIVGFQIFNYVAPQRGGRGFGLGAFRGLEREYQHGGVGAWLLRGALEQLALDARDRLEPPPLGHLVEVEPPQGAQGRELFAQKTGAILLEGDYLEPPMLSGVSYISPQELSGVVPRPMQLVFYPFERQGSLNPQETCALLEGIYLDYYRLERDDPLLLHACRSVEGLESTASAPLSP